MTYCAGLSYDKPLAGLVVMSGSMILPKEVTASIHEANRRTPLLVMHGTQDGVISLQGALGSVQYATDAGCNGTFLQYEMGHTTDPEELAYLTQWLAEHLPFARPVPVPVPPS